MLANVLLLVFTTLIALFITAIIFMSRAVRPAMKWAFALSTVDMTLWNITIYIADSVQTNLYFWNSLVFLFPSVALVGLYLLVSLLGHEAGDRLSWKLAGSRLTRALLVASMLAQLLATTSGQIFSTVLYNADGSYTFKRGPMYLVYVVGVLLFLVLLAVRVVRNYRDSDKYSQERRALRVVMWTILAVIGYSVTTNIAIPVITGSQDLISLGTFSLDIFSFGLALSIVRYRLFDIRFFVVRAVTYLISAFAVSLVFIVPFALFLNRLLRTDLSAGQLALAVCVTAVFFYSVMYLRRYFDRATSRIFFRGYYDPQDVLDKLSSILVRTADIKVLRESTAAMIKDVLKPEFMRYALLSEEDELATVLNKFGHKQATGIIDIDASDMENEAILHAFKEQNATLTVKLRTTHEDLGFIVMGHKQSGEAYSARDKKLLSIAADEIAISLQNALRFEAIKHFNVTLQEEVDAATKKLKQQNKRLEELDNTKDDFISMASHQLRTPLTAVKGYLSMVLEGDAGTLNRMQTQMLQQAFTSSQRMVFLITDLLNVSRLKTGKFVIDAAPTNLDTVVEEELKQLHDTAQAKKIELTYDRPTSFPELMIDDVKIRQVIMNFVDNAIYYTPEGGHINVELVENPQTVELRVTDDGIGVPKSEQHHLFTKFYRATNARTARPDGTGLGLFMAQKVILAQGGSVIFSSQEHKGSTFGFTFSKNKLAVPMKADAEKAASKKSPAKEPALS